MHSEGRYGIERGCVARYLLQTDAVDTIGTNDGTLNGGMGFGTVGGRACAIFDGVNDSVNVAGSSIFSFSGDVSVVGWWRFATASATMSLWGFNNAEFKLLWEHTGSQFLLYANGVDTAIAATTVQDTWYHFAVVRSGSTITLYRDAVSLGTSSDGGNLNEAEDGFAIGTYATGTGLSQYFQGGANDIRIYNRALSAAEVARLARIY